MKDQIHKVPMYSQEKIAATFEGLKVKWTGVVKGVRELSNGIVDFTMKCDGPLVCMKVKVDDYPILKTVRGEGDELATVTGTIDYVQTNGLVHLKDVRLTFSFRPRIEPLESTQPDHSSVPQKHSAMVTRSDTSSHALKFNNKDRVKIKGSYLVGVVEQIRTVTGGEAMYWIEFNSDFSTRVWAKEDDLERV